MSDLFGCAEMRGRSRAPAVNDDGWKFYLQLCQKEEKKVPKSYSNTKINERPHGETDYS